MKIDIILIVLNIILVLIYSYSSINEEEPEYRLLDLLCAITW